MKAFDREGRVHIETVTDRQGLCGTVTHKIAPDRATVTCAECGGRTEMSDGRYECVGAA